MAISEPVIDEWQGVFTVLVQCPGGVVVTITNGGPDSGALVEQAVQTLVTHIDSHPDLSIMSAVLGRTASSVVTP